MNEINYAGNSLTVDDTIRVGVINLSDGNNWIELDSTPVKLAAGLLTPEALWFRERSRIERPRGRPICLPHPRRERREEAHAAAPVLLTRPRQPMVGRADFRRFNHTRSDCALNRYHRFEQVRTSPINRSGCGKFSEHRFADLVYSTYPK